MWHYSLAGLGISSDLELPLPAGSPLTTEILLKLGPSLEKAESPAETEWHWSAPDEAELEYVGLGRARVSGGKEILLRPCAPSGAPSEWRGLLIPCFAALFHQRGDFSLHASAVCIAGQAVGFMGHCGAGKSTLVAQLVGDDIRFVCDDLLLLGRDEEKIPLAYPGFSIIKLWEDAVPAAKGHFSRLGSLYPDATKDGFAPSENESSTTPSPLHSLFVLRDGDEVRVDPLSKREALAELLQHTYGLANFRQKPLDAHFRQCSELAQRVPVKILTRPRNFAAAVEVERAIREAVGVDVVAPV